MTAAAWRTVRSGLVTLALMGAVLLALAPAPASASGTGSISGTIKGGGISFAGTCVRDVWAYDSTGGKTGISGQTTLWNAESYTISGLEPGAYRMRFDEWCVGRLGPFPTGGPTSHVGEYFNDKQNLQDATPVTVTGGSATTGVNVLFGEDGTISGTVTDSNGTPLDGVCVEAFDTDGNPSGVVAHTVDGSYAVNALDSGFYRLKFSDCLNPDDPFVTTEYYDNQTTLEAALPVGVGKGLDTAGIDARLVTKPEVPEPTTRKAAIGKVSVKGPARVRQGRKTTEKVTITNSGNAAARRVQLRVIGRGVRFKASIGSIPAGATRSFKARLKLNEAGRVKLTFRITSANAGGKSVERVIAVAK